MPVANDDFRKALGRLAAGVCIISTALEGQRRGVTATAVCSVSASPPTVLVCINTSTGTCKMIQGSGRFAVNLLSEEHRSVADVFAGRNGLQGDDRFAHGDWEQGQQLGMPVLTAAPSALECRVDQVIAAGTHAVFLGIVEGAYFADNSSLVYHEGAFHVIPPSERCLKLAS